MGARNALELPWDKLLEADQAPGGRAATSAGAGLNCRPEANRTVTRYKIRGERCARAAPLAPAKRPCINCLAEELAAKIGAEWEYDLVSQACFNDAHAVEKVLEKRGLVFGSTMNLHSPSEWARQIILDIAVNKLRNATPEERKQRKDYEKFMEKEEKRLELAGVGQKKTDAKKLKGGKSEASIAAK